MPGKKYISKTYPIMKGLLPFTKEQHTEPLSKQSHGPDWRNRYSRFSFTKIPLPYIARGQFFQAYFA
ncbi:hypothetical protein HMPREF0080_00237 [Anaeroglobus geminatus F0357]|uniref:Uncharacterized protein n=1 Tax=Anaeroglobus geminatus F0357 TaxID=861450 RepID=G9YF27_9FIRM|nr:hypothetical protein HMPREF0080_00237 [Anaeroglobus geminatus F0357]